MVTLNTIDKLSLPVFPFDGAYLKNKGMKEGEMIGKTLEILRNDWIANDFEISNQKALNIIKSQNN